MSYSSSPPVLLWLRRDFRMHDHEALTAAAESGRPVIPVFILDPLAEALGAAPKWRLGEAVRCYAGTLTSAGSRLVLRRGPALDCLKVLIADTGADTVYWTRAYDPETVARDKAVRAALISAGIAAKSFPGHLLFEPWRVETAQGRPYSVFTPYWRKLAERAVPAPLPAPKTLTAPPDWPRSDRLEDWALGTAMQRGAAVVRRHAPIGEVAARDRLAAFLDIAVARYAQDRDRPGLDATSRLSAHLTTGEISPRILWHAALSAGAEGRPGAETFRKELVWREFAWHLLWHHPRLATESWRDGWDRFPWQGDGAEAERWRRGLTGVDMVDAGMRELYVTGTMHNRVRMIAASYLTKHLLTDWRIGLRWFADTLIDWDPASNATGWQWVAGSGPDAAPYFRIFNPDTQAAKFDPDARYRRHYLDGPGAAAFRQACPKAWGLGADTTRPAPAISLQAGRARALEAYAELKATQGS